MQRLRLYLGPYCEGNDFTFSKTDTTLTAEEHDNHGVMTTQCKQEEVVCWIQTLRILHSIFLFFQIMHVEQCCVWQLSVGITNSDTATTVNLWFIANESLVPHTQ